MLAFYIIKPIKLFIGNIFEWKTMSEHSNICFIWFASYDLPMPLLYILRKFDHCYLYFMLLRGYSGIKI
jgi:hypothetical protein